MDESDLNKISSKSSAYWIIHLDINCDYTNYEIIIVIISFGYVSISIICILFVDEIIIIQLTSKWCY